MQSEVMFAGFGGQGILLSAKILAHAAMEPINCTAVVRSDGSCEVWVGNQSPSLVRWYAAEAAGVDSDRGSRDARGRSRNASDRPARSVEGSP